VADKPPAGWEALKPEGHFLDGSLLARNVGDTFECHFKGRVVGLYYEIRKDAGIVSCSVDGQPGREVDTSWGPTYKFNRESYTLLADNLTDAEHTLKITVLDKKNDLSNGHEFRLGYLMVAG
jgi:hypothetical protein